MIMCMCMTVQCIAGIRRHTAYSMMEAKDGGWKKERGRERGMDRGRDREVGRRREKERERGEGRCRQKRLETARPQQPLQGTRAVNMFT